MKLLNGAMIQPARILHNTQKPLQGLRHGLSSTLALRNDFSSIPLRILSERRPKLPFDDKIVGEESNRSIRLIKCGVIPGDLNDRYRIIAYGFGSSPCLWQWLVLQVRISGTLMSY